MMNSRTVRTITPESYDDRRDRFFFPVTIKTPLTILVKELRSEEDYDSDPCADENALHAILRFNESLPGSKYAVISGGEAAPVSRRRSRQGLLRPDSTLRKLKHYDLEVPFKDNHSRLGVVFPLPQAGCEDDPAPLLNWINGMMFTSSMTLEKVCGIAGKWLDGDVTKPLGFNYDAVADAMVEFPGTLVMRYFPADNGKNEIVVLAGHKALVNKEMEMHLDNIVI